MSGVAPSYEPCELDYDELVCIQAACYAILRNFLDLRDQAPERAEAQTERNARTLFRAYVKLSASAGVSMDFELLDRCHHAWGPLP